MTTAKNRFQILKLLTKKHVLNTKNIYFLYAHKVGKYHIYVNN